MKIEEVKIVQVKAPGFFYTRAYRKARKPVIYIRIKEETILENLQNRRSRPHKEYKKLIPEILARLNITTQYKWKWDQKAGCSMCPCSPGFVPSNMSSVPAEQNLLFHNIWATIVD